MIKILTVINAKKVTQRHLEDRVKLRMIETIISTNRPVRTARAVVQHYNAAMHVAVHNTQRQFGYSTNSALAIAYAEINP